MYAKKWCVVVLWKVAFNCWVRIHFRWLSKNGYRESDYDRFLWISDLRNQKVYFRKSILTTRWCFLEKITNAITKDYFDIKMKFKEHCDSNLLNRTKSYYLYFWEDYLDRLMEQVVIGFELVLNCLPSSSLATIINWLWKDSIACSIKSVCLNL